MAEYYLISQLPSLDGLAENAPLPITEEYFLELCSSSLGKKMLREIESISLLPPPVTLEKSSSALLESWNNGERNLRIALAKVRAEKMNKPYNLDDKNLSSELIKIANSATDIDNPLEAENFLLAYRLAFLETLRPTDTFSDDYLFYYGLKLKLILRMKQFDEKLGESTYKNIYNSILNGERLEAVQ